MSSETSAIAKDARSGPILLGSVWTIGVIAIGLIVWWQSATAQNSDQDVVKNALAARTTAISFMLLPMLGMAWGVWPMKEAHRRWYGPGPLFVSFLSAIYIALILFIVCNEGKYFRGELKDFLGYGGIVISAIQGIVIFAITRLS